MQSCHTYTQCHHTHCHPLQHPEIQGAGRNSPLSRRAIIGAAVLLGMEQRVPDEGVICCFAGEDEMALLSVPASATYEQ